MRKLWNLHSFEQANSWCFISLELMMEPWPKDANFCQKEMDVGIEGFWDATRVLLQVPSFWDRSCSINNALVTVKCSWSSSLSPFGGGECCLAVEHMELERLGYIKLSAVIWGPHRVESCRRNNCVSARKPFYQLAIEQETVSISPFLHWAWSITSDVTCLMG